MLRISITVPAPIPVTRITTYCAAADGRMSIQHPGKDLIGVNCTTDVTLDVEESRLPALACSLGPTFAMSSVRLPDIIDGKIYSVRISGGKLAGRVVSEHTYRMDADDDAQARNRNLNTDDDYAYVVEEME